MPRLVTQSFSQVHGKCLFNTFSPRVRVDTVESFLDVVDSQKSKCRGFNVMTECLARLSLQGLIYVAFLQVITICPSLDPFLNHSLYGLTRAARDWNSLSTFEVIKLGFEPSSNDPGLFIHKPTDDMRRAGNEGSQCKQ